MDGSLELTGMNLSGMIFQSPAPPQQTLMSPPRRRLVAPLSGDDTTVSVPLSPISRLPPNLSEPRVAAAVGRATSQLSYLFGKLRSALGASPHTTTVVAAGVPVGHVLLFLRWLQLDVSWETCAKVLREVIGNHDEIIEAEFSACVAQLIHFHVILTQRAAVSHLMTSFAPPQSRTVDYAEVTAFLETVLQDEGKVSRMEEKLRSMRKRHPWMAAVVSEPVIDVFVAYSAHLEALSHTMREVVRSASVELLCSLVQHLLKLRSSPFSQNFNGFDPKVLQELERRFLTASGVSSYPRMCECVAVLALLYSHVTQEQCETLPGHRARTYVAEFFGMLFGSSFQCDESFRAALDEAAVRAASERASQLKDLTSAFECFLKRVFLYYCCWNDTNGLSLITLRKYRKAMQDCRVWQAKHPATPQPFPSERYTDEVFRSVVHRAGQVDGDRHGCMSSPSTPFRAIANKKSSEEGCGVSFIVFVKMLEGVATIAYGPSPDSLPKFISAYHAALHTAPPLFFEPPDPSLMSILQSQAAMLRALYSAYTEGPHFGYKQLQELFHDAALIPAHITIANLNRLLRRILSDEPYPYQPDLSISFDAFCLVVEAMARLSASKCSATTAQPTSPSASLISRGGDALAMGVASSACDQIRIILHRLGVLDLRAFDARLRSRGRSILTPSPSVHVEVIPMHDT